MATTQEGKTMGFNATSMQVHLHLCVLFVRLGHKRITGSQIPVTVKSKLLFKKREALRINENLNQPL